MVYPQLFCSHTADPKQLTGLLDSWQGSWLLCYITGACVSTLPTCVCSLLQLALCMCPPCDRRSFSHPFVPCSALMSHFHLSVCLFGFRVKGHSFEAPSQAAWEGPQETGQCECKLMALDLAFWWMICASLAMQNYPITHEIMSHFQMRYRAQKFYNCLCVSYLNSPPIF